MADKKVDKVPAADAENGKLDNNKRLAFLETSVSALTLALAGAGIELKDDQDPIAQAIALVDSWRGQTLSIAELTVAVAAAKGVDPASIEDPFAEAIEGLSCATLRGQLLNAIGAHLAEHYPSIVEAGGTLPEQVIEALGTEAPPPAPLEPDAAAEKIAELEKQVEALTAELEAAKAPPARGARAKDKSVRARKCGPVKCDREAVAAALADPSASLEIVLSDGVQEIVDFAPYEVRGRDFTKHSLGQLLTAPLFARGASSPRTIRGFGLFRDGKQIAFCAHPDVGIAPGAERKFTKAVFF